MSEFSYVPTVNTCGCSGKEAQGKEIGIVRTQQQDVLNQPIDCQFKNAVYCDANQAELSDCETASDTADGERLSSSNSESSFSHGSGSEKGSPLTRSVGVIGAPPGLEAPGHSSTVPFASVFAARDQPKSKLSRGAKLFVPETLRMDAKEIVGTARTAKAPMTAAPAYPAPALEPKLPPPAPTVEAPEYPAPDFPDLAVPPPPITSAEVPQKPTTLPPGLRTPLCKEAATRGLVRPPPGLSQPLRTGAAAFVPKSAKWTAPPAWQSKFAAAPPVQGFY